MLIGELSILYPKVNNGSDHMWRCKSCRQELDDKFNMCWNCGTHRNGNEPAKVMELIHDCKIDKRYLAFFMAFIFGVLRALELIRYIKIPFVMGEKNFILIALILGVLAAFIMGLSKQEIRYGMIYFLFIMLFSMTLTLAIHEKTINIFTLYIGPFTWALVYTLYFSLSFIPMFIVTKNGMKLLINSFKNYR